MSVVVSNAGSIDLQNSAIERRSWVKRRKGQPSPMAQLSPEELQYYAHSPAHLAVAQGDNNMLRSVLCRLPRLPAAGELTTEVESIVAEHKADLVSSVLDHREVAGRETPLHLAVRLGNVAAVEMLVAAGADCSLQNGRGWNALQEAVCARKDVIAVVIIKYQQRMSWAKWCRRSPRIIAQLSRMRDFYMEVTFQFESSVIPFIGRIAPSDTYKIWKRGANLRADMTLDSFDGFKIHRSDRSFLFLGECNAGSGHLLILTHKVKEVTNAFDGAEKMPSDTEAVAQLMKMTKGRVYRPGIDVTQAEIVPQLSWRRHEKSEMVSSWKSKLYDMHNVSVSMRCRRVLGDEEEEEEDEDFANLLTDEEKRQLKQALRVSSVEYSDTSPGRKENAKQEKGWLSRGSRKVDKSKTSSSKSEKNKQSKVEGNVGPVEEDEKQTEKSTKKNPTDESEYTRGLRPVLWLTNDFPLEIEELLPLLDILASKVKAIRRLREVLITKLPAGTFPVKMAIPVVPTIKVVVTFSKFEELPDPQKPAEQQSASWFSWMRGSPAAQQHCPADPFSVPADYRWKGPVVVPERTKI